MKTFKQVFISIDKLKPYLHNSRLHSTEQIIQIKESIKKYGFTNPLLIDKDFNIIAGHGRLEAIKALNRVDYKDKLIKDLPCIVVDGLSESDYKALVIADNKIALNASWDLETLKSELQILENENYNLDLLGFNDDELEHLLKQVDLNVDLDNNLNNEPPVDNKQMEAKIIKEGDLIELGKHRILCGDSTILENVNKLNCKADIIITSPPYNCNSSGVNNFKEDAKNIKVSMYLKGVNDNLNKDDYFNFCLKVLNNIKSIVKDNHLILWNISYNQNARDDYGKIIFSNENPFQVMDTIIWKKPSCIPIDSKIILSRKCEFIFAMALNEKSYLSNFVNYESNNLIETIQMKAQQDIHRAAFSLDLPYKLMLLYNIKKKDLVFFEPFLGSGTMLLYCEKNNYVLNGIEKEPLYCELSIKRYCEMVNNYNIKINNKNIYFKEVLNG